MDLSSTAEREEDAVADRVDGMCEEDYGVPEGLCEGSELPRVLQSVSCVFVVGGRDVRLEAPLNALISELKWASDAETHTSTTT